MPEPQGFISEQLAVFANLKRAIANAADDEGLWCNTDVRYINDDGHFEERPELLRIDGTIDMMKLISELRPIDQTAHMPP